MELIMESDASLPVVIIDGTRIAQVLDNLLSNAHKYAGDSQVHIRIIEEDGRVRVEVKDHGPGIPQEHSTNLFQRFYRVPSTSKTVRGTGLGLFICRKIIEAHGGEIGVDSQTGEGSCFYFTLPVFQSAIPLEVELDDEPEHDDPGS
jgi:two-component system clock-associated histidine kinase SasA